MEKIVIYGTNYGTTKEYAKWIGESLECEVKNYKDLKVEDLIGYNTIIGGGGTYASSYLGSKLFYDTIKAYPDKNYIFFACCLANPNIGHSREEFRDNFYKEIAEENKDKVNFYMLGGRLDFKKLKVKDRIIMWLFVKMLKGKRLKT